MKKNHLLSILLAVLAMPVIAATNTPGDSCANGEFSSTKKGGILICADGKYKHSYEVGGCTAKVSDETGSASISLDHYHVADVCFPENLDSIAADSKAIAIRQAGAREDVVFVAYSGPFVISTATNIIAYGKSGKRYEVEVKATAPGFPSPVSTVGPR